MTMSTALPRRWPQELLGDTMDSTCEHGKTCQCKHQGLLDAMDARCIKTGCHVYLLGPPNRQYIHWPMAHAVGHAMPTGPGHSQSTSSCVVLHCTTRRSRPVLHRSEHSFLKITHDMVIKL